MIAFFRLLAAFLVGGVIGAVAVLYLQPTFSIVVTNAPAGVTTLVDAHPPVVDEPEFTPPPTPVSAPVAGGRPAPAAPAAASSAQAPIDYAQVVGRPAFWPSEVQAAVPSVITFGEEGKKTEEMRIAAGAILQLSGVQPDGTLELRAQGRKFTLHAKFTDFDALVRKKAQELIARASGGTSPAPAPADAAVPAPAPVVATAPSAVAKPKGPLTMQQKLDALYGRSKEEPVAAPVAPAVPAAPSAAPAPPASAAPAAPAAPAPAAPATDDQSAKEADLKRRMDGLFKPAATPAR